MSLPIGPVVCTDDCDFEIPSVSFAECNPQVNESQIAKIYIAQPDAADFTDWSDVNEWTARLTDTGNDADSIRPLTVMGDKPLPEKTTKTISGQRDVDTAKKHTINYDIDESNATNHDFQRGTKCVKRVKFWYETISGLLFGGNSGIVGTLSQDMTLSRADGDIILYSGTLKWNSTDTEERITSPIA